MQRKTNSFDDGQENIRLRKQSKPSFKGCKIVSIFVNLSSYDGFKFDCIAGLLRNYFIYNCNNKLR